MNTSTEATQTPAVPNHEISIRANYVYTGAGDAVILDLVDHPASREAFAQALQKAGIDGAQGRVLYLDGIDSVIPGLDNVLPDYVDIDEMNYLAVKINRMDDHNQKLFAALIEAQKHCDSLPALINLTENLRCFEFHAGMTATSYGQELLLEVRDFSSALVKKLELSDNPVERDISRHISLLESCVAPEDYALAAAKMENGVFTSGGYLTDEVEISVIYHGSDDIPTEYRISDCHAQSEIMRNSEPPVMVKNADLTALLMKMHALGGDYISDARFNMTILEGRRNAEYFLLMREQSLYLTGAAHAYRVGTTANDNIMNAAVSPDTKVFMLLVTDVHQPHVIGDLVELNLAELQRDIRQHCISHTRVDAVPKIGPEVSYTPEQWDALDVEDLHRLQSWTRHFESDDHQDVLSHVHDLRERLEEAGKEIPEDAFLAEHNKQYMHRAENPQPDMIRVTLPAAKEMLLHEDAEVYRLFPQGPERLAKLDALPARGGLLYLENREFAIKPRDLGNLDQWASREMASLSRAAPQRGEKDKQKSHGSEL